MITLDQSEASFQIKSSLLTNQRPVSHPNLALGMTIYLVLVSTSLKVEKDEDNVHGLRRNITINPRSFP